jgi:anti-sigma-K factor RskA
LTEPLDPVVELLARAVPAYGVPAGLERRTLAAVERAAAPRRRRPRPRRRLRLVLAFAAAAALAVGVTQLDRPNEPELDAVLTSPRGAVASARVTKTGIGRVVSFRTDDLPVLPKGEYYELWFVGPGDTLARPNRISAGTFHPDERGRSRVELAAAVDPARFPVLSVTAEPADGDPRRTGPEVLRSG